MIILATAIILSLNNSGIIGKADEAVFKTDVKSMQEELAIELSEAILNDTVSEIEGKDADLVLKSAKKYPGMFKIYNQKLTYIGEKVNKTQSEYLASVNIEQYWDNGQVYLFTYTDGGKTLTGISDEYYDNDIIYEDKEKTIEVGHVIIPSTVTSIGSNAFKFTNITSVEIPNSVTSIESEAFMHCTSLESIKIPGTVKDIGDSAFAECMALSNVEILEGVTSIGNRVFSESGVQSIKLPSTLTSIGDTAFDGCCLTSIEIPAGVTSIGMNAFSYCGFLETITILSPNCTVDGIFGYQAESLKVVNVVNETMKVAVENELKNVYECTATVNIIGVE